MKRFTLFIIIVTVSLLSIPSSESRAEKHFAPSEGLKTYELNGVLINFDAANRQATIAHEMIPGYMAAMTMAFDVHDITSMQRLRPGDKLKAKLWVGANTAWIDGIIKSGPSLALSRAAESDPSELSVGDALPNVTLIDQLGMKIHLADYQGQALAITFIYTRCPLPTYCPLLSRHFQTAQILLKRISTNNGGRFLSISMDPTHDSPEVLAAYAKNYEADPNHWIFATGLGSDISSLGKDVGLEFRNEAGRIDHNLRTVVVDKLGHIQHIFRGNQWTPQELVSQMMLAGR